MQGGVHAVHLINASKLRTGVLHCFFVPEMKFTVCVLHAKVRKGKKGESIFCGTFASSYRKKDRAVSSSCQRRGRGSLEILRRRSKPQLSSTGRLRKKQKDEALLPGDPSRTIAAASIPYSPGAFKTPC